MGHYPALWGVLAELCGCVTRTVDHAHDDDRVVSDPVVNGVALVEMDA